MEMFRFLRIAGGAFVMSMILGGCSSGRLLGTFPKVTEKTLIGETSKGWLKYKFYVLPSAQTPAGDHHKPRKEQLVSLSIAIINMHDATSPLRRLCSSLDQYNTYYEYLLNQTKNDLLLLQGNTVQYPVYYAFENNYNVFPFETINIGYKAAALKARRHSKQTTALLFVDRIFSKDTVRCNLTPAHQ